ncbi:MAG: multicopper oxidase domain-containing protein [bacterium]
MRTWRVAILAGGLTLAIVAQSAHAADCRHLPAALAPRVSPNDNRNPTGAVRDGVMSLRLVMRDASWYPDGPTGCALQVRAFAEEGQSARIPGPLIRVQTGMDVRVSVRNAFATSVWVRGLQARDVTILDSTEIAPGETHEFRFRAGIPGAWYYWAGSATARVPVSNENGQLVGALVVDPVPDTSGHPAVHHAVDDRVFVMTRWTPAGTTGNRGFQLNAVNGRSWPHTERLTYTMGDSVRWQVINASDELHMMHLHGFYFVVQERGDAVHDSALARAQKNTVVTTATRRGEWMQMAWAPDRPGNWLFHCHIVSHMSADQRLDRMPGAAGDPSHEHAASANSKETNHATESMAGLLLGITVLPARTSTGAARSRRVSAPDRVVHLFADTRPNMFGDRPGFGFVVQRGTSAPARDSVLVPSAPLVLTRGQPVAITVHNRLASSLAVHWHGIELESYADGVGGWSGAGRRVAPMMAPDDSFVARFTPPRAGTFMYHVHNEHGEELSSGLYAPLLVMEPGETFDATTDLVFIIATAGPGIGRGEDAPAFINGTLTPDTLSLVAGTTYRIRLIDIAANEAHTVAIRGPAGAASWRALARDGRSLPTAQAVAQPAQEVTAAGVTRDFEFTPSTKGDYSLVVASIVSAKPTGKQTTVVMRVR